MCMGKELLAVESGFYGLDGYEEFRQDQENTPLTIKGIFESLDVWREERGLQHTVGNIAANIGEEIVEYLRAENDEQRVDALCDMFVFSVNALYASEKRRYDYFVSKLCEWIEDHFDKNSFNSIIHGFSTMVYNNDTYTSLTFCYIAKHAKFQIQKLGFDFFIAMDETLKEIHSRKGAWNDKTQKWEKFKTKEAMALWYKADYSKAKIA